MKKLEGKVAIITGGVSGIGAATARLFAEEGAKLVLVDINEEKGQAFVEELNEAGHSEVLFVKADVANEADVKNIFDQTKEKFGSLDILFNNAGIGEVQPSHEVTFERFQQIVSIDLNAVFALSQIAIRDFFLEQGAGVIVNTASMYGWVGAAGSAAYNAAKGGVINLTRSLGVEYGEQNIRVNALCPGYIDTPIILEDYKQVLKDTMPMKRLGTSEEMAKAVLFLASEDSSYMTGASITIDGGFTAQ